MLFAGKPLWVSAELREKDRRSTEADIVDSRTLYHQATGPVVGQRAYVTIGFDSGAQLHAEFCEIPSTNWVQVMGTKGIIQVPLGVAAADPFICSKPYASPNDPQANWTPIPVEWGQWGMEHNNYTYDLWNQWLTDPASKPMAIDGKHPMDAENGRLSIEMIHAAFESHFQNGNRVAIPLKDRAHPLERRMKKVS